MAQALPTAKAEMPVNGFLRSSVFYHQSGSLQLALYWNHSVCSCSCFWKMRFHVPNCGLKGNKLRLLLVLHARCMHALHAYGANFRYLLIRFPYKSLFYQKSTPRCPFSVNTPSAVQNVEARWKGVAYTDWHKRPVMLTYVLSCSDTYNGHKSAIGERGIIWNAQNDHLIRSCDNSCYPIGPCSIANWRPSLPGHFKVSDKQFGRSAVWWASWDVCGISRHHIRRSRKLAS